MKKILTISIAAYNAENFLRKTLDSLLIKNLDLLEVLIINDGSKDDTISIAREYEKKYPNVFKAIDKENGGYGSTINLGIKLATGKYFKQLDCDDWYDTDNLDRLCLLLKEQNSDVIYNPYIIHNIIDNVEKIERNNLENYQKNYRLEDAIQYVSPVLYMHSLAYKTELLKDKNITLDEHCLYTDTQYVMFPLIYSQTIKILDFPVYVYRTGDINQSVGKIGRLKHYKEHIKMADSLLDNLENNKDITNNKLEYFKNYLASILASEITNYLMLLKLSFKNYRLIIDRDKKIYKSNKDIYMRMENYSKTVKILRRTKFIGYFALNVYKRIK